MKTVKIPCIGYEIEADIYERYDKNVIFNLTGFAWGNGIERIVMMKNGIEDVRHFESANLKFLRQF